jgi:DNA-binding response OmpR family regulator
MDQKDAHKKIVDRFITKPFNMEQILTLVSELLTERKTESVNA